MDEDSKISKPTQQQGIAASIGVLLSLFFIAYSTPCMAGLPEQQPSGRAAALGYSSVALPDGWAVFTNQAAMTQTNELWVGIHHQNLFLTQELNFSAIGASIPLYKGVAGLSIKRMGFSDFHESKGGVGYALNLSPNFALGVQGNLHHVWASSEYGSTYALTAEGGIFYTPIQNLSLGVHILNPTHNTLHLDDKIPAILRIGGAYSFSESFLIASQLEQSIGHDPSPSFGIEFLPIPNLALRTGIATNPTVACFGVGYSLFGLQISLAFTYHQRLGPSPHLSVSYLNNPKAPTDPATNN